MPPILHVRELLPGVPFSFSSEYSNPESDYDVEFAVADALSERDRATILGFDGIDTYGDDFEWIIERTVVIHVSQPPQ